MLRYLRRRSGQRYIACFRHTEHLGGAAVADDVLPFAIKREPDCDGHRIEHCLKSTFLRLQFRGDLLRKRAMAMLVLTRASDSCALKGFIR